MDRIDEIVVVLETSEDATALEEKVTSARELAAVSKSKVLIEADGLIGGLIRVMGKEGEGFRVAREEAVRAIWAIAVYGCDEVGKGLFKYDGLVDCLLGRMSKGGEVERKCAVGVIMSIAGGELEVKRGLFEHEGLIDGLIEVVGQTGNEYEYAREWAVVAMNNIADGDDEVKAGLFHFPGLMTCIEKVLLDTSLDGTDTKLCATQLATRLLQWQRCDSVTLTFKTYTLMLKLCDEKVPRAHPEPTSRLATFFSNNSEV